LFLTMELLPAETLHEKIKREGRMHSDDALPIISDVANALTAIHTAGIVHRDLKTSNILLVPNGKSYRAVVTDFGLAITLPGKDGLHVTQTGQVIGTPEFMAPEQLTKGPITPATDVYALGLVMYELTTAQLPLQGESPLTIAARRISEDAPSPRKIVDSLDRRWEKTILRCLERNPRDRFQTAAEAVGSLHDSSVKSRLTLLSRQRRWMSSAIAIFFCALASIFALYYWKLQKPNRSDMVAKRLWTGATGTPVGVLSTDGKQLIDIDWQTADVISIDLASGNKRRITNSGLWFHPYDFSAHPLSTLLSPEGKRVAYSLVHPWRTKGDLRIINTSGGSYRTVYSGDGSQIWPLDWSPDGQKLIAWLESIPLGSRTQSIQEHSRLVMFTIRDGSMQTVKSLGSNNIRKLSFSPDGRYIAYDSPQENGSPNHDIFLITLASGREIRAVTDAANDYLLGWSPDGASLIFASDRAGTHDAWRLRIADGNPTGYPQLLKKDVGQIYCLRITKDGSLYYSHLMSSTDIYTAIVNGTPSAPTRVSKGTVGSNRSPDFSADGQYLLYQTVSNPLASRWTSAATTSTLTRVSLQTNQQQDFVLQLTSAVGRTRWSPDGKSILLAGVSNDQPPGLYIAEIETGKARLIVPNLKNNWVRQYYWASDGKAIYYLMNKGGKIVQRDLQTNREQIVCSSAADFALSMDGKWIAAMSVNIQNGKIGLSIAPAGGGIQKEILELKMPDWISAFAWTPDHHILFLKGRRDRIDDPHHLWRIAAAGGEPTDLKMTTDYAYDIRVHPDGKRIAIWTLIDTSELWVLENFL
jgi:serine/threonine protein kinase